MLSVSILGSFTQVPTNQSTVNCQRSTVLDPRITRLVGAGQATDQTRPEMLTPISSACIPSLQTLDRCLHRSTSCLKPIHTHPANTFSRTSGNVHNHGIHLYFGSTLELAQEYSAWPRYLIRAKPNSPTTSAAKRRIISGETYRFLPSISGPLGRDPDPAIRIPGVRLRRGEGRGGTVVA